MKIPEEDRFYMECGREVTKRVSAGLTTVLPGIGLITEHLAEKMASQQRRYQYPIYTKVNGKLKQYGYDIPH